MKIRDNLGVTYVGRIDGGESKRFETLEAAENYLWFTIGAADPEGLERGDYFLDTVTEDSL